MNRRPVVAGQFYTDSPVKLRAEVRAYLDEAPARPADAPARTRLVMVPHAGYVFSGRVAGVTLGQAALADTLLLLGPNHTGMGTPFSVWPEGAWETPLGALPVDAALAEAMLRSDARLQADHLGHVREHSLEVVAPFLLAMGRSFKIVPVAVAEHSPAALSAVAEALVKVIQAENLDVSIVVSSDMSHFVSDAEARQLDRMALDAILGLDPLGLYSVVREAGITMCGVLPMTLGLMIALKLGATSARLTAYATSGDVSGDVSSVVGYAGVLVE